MNIKINTAPPFIIFFDILIVLLFFLVLNQSSDGGVKFQLPADELFSGARLVYQDKQSGEYRYSDTHQRLKPSSILFAEPCGKQTQCLQAEGPGQPPLFIVFPQGLTEELGVLSTFAARAGCKGFKAVVSTNGVVDREQTFKSNACFQHIPAIDVWRNESDHHGE